MTQASRCETCAKCNECPLDEVPDELFSEEWEKYFTEGRTASDIASDLYAIGHKAGRMMTECGEWSSKICENGEENGSFPRTWRKDFCGQWAPIPGEEPRTLKEGEIAVRLDVLNALRISLEDIRGMASAIQRQSIEDMQWSIKQMGEWALKEAEQKYGVNGKKDEP